SVKTLLMPRMNTQFLAGVNVSGRVAQAETPIFVTLSKFSPRVYRVGVVALRRGVRRTGPTGGMRVLAAGSAHPV
ncbi:MAG: hypothetical protein OXE50_07980, partial [Chloroflexi bacterium]|nr:hypothetical protein [Chloroflexota bacterium]